MARTERDLYADRLSAADAEVADAVAAYEAATLEERHRNPGLALRALYGAPGRRRVLLVEMSDTVARALGVKAERDAEVARRIEGDQRSQPRTAAP